MGGRGRNLGIAGVIGIGWALALAGLGAAGVLGRDDPEPPAAPIEMPVPRCPILRHDVVHLLLMVRPAGFALQGTDGFYIDIPSHDFETLRTRLRERRIMEPNRTAIYVVGDGMPDTGVAERALALAREEGFRAALHCEGPIELERAPLIAPQEPFYREPTEREHGVPRVRTGDVEVRGSVSRDAIRRVVRRHVDEVRFCYEEELAQRPDLEGRIDIAFIIAPSGQVQSASVSSSTLGNARVEGCIVQAVRRWTFPAPEGIAAVRYPYLLSTAR